MLRVLCSIATPKKHSAEIDGDRRFDPKAQRDQAKAQKQANQARAKRLHAGDNPPHSPAADG